MEEYTSRQVRLTNQRNILNALFREGPLTNQELTKRLRLSHPTVSTIIRELMEKGLVVRGDTVKTEGGRPPARLEIAADARHAVGIHVTVEHIRFVLVNLSGSIVAKRRHSIPLAHTAAYWEGFSDLLERFIMESLGRDDSLIGVGLAVQSPVERGPGGIRMPGVVGGAGWDYALIDAAMRRPVVLNNDAKMASFAQVFGEGKMDEVVYILLGRGVGGAIISGKRLLNENCKNAEFGHMTVEPYGRRCACGRLGCLGAYCSVSALTKRAGVELEAFFEGVRNNEVRFCTLWSEYLDYLAIGVNNLRMIFDTELVIGGEMSPYIREFQDGLSERLTQRNAFGEPADYVKIAEYGEYDAAMGSALAQVEKFMNA